MAELFELNRVCVQFRNFMLTKNKQMFEYDSRSNPRKSPFEDL